MSCNQAVWGNIRQQAEIFAEPMSVLVEDIAGQNTFPRGFSAANACSAGSWDKW